MTELTTYNNPAFGDIRGTLDEHGEPWFVAADVCRCLDIGNPSQAMTRLDDDERTLISNEGGKPTNFVNEPGLYTLVLSSRKPEAKAFKRWITHEALPAIRKHGAYMTPDTIKKVLTDPDTIIQLATQLKEEQEARRQLEARNGELLELNAVQNQ